MLVTESIQIKAMIKCVDGFVLRKASPLRERLLLRSFVMQVVSNARRFIPVRSRNFSFSLPGVDYTLNNRINLKGKKINPKLNNTAT